MKNITYLIGAGASFGTLPLVSNLPAELLDFADSIPKMSETEPPDQIEKKLQEDFHWLGNEAKKQASIDTLARQFSLNGQRNNLNKLKNILTIFFYYKQVCNYPNKRYDLFFSTLLDENLKMPENIKVVSWNYDLQFELTYNNYTCYNDVQKNQEQLCIINKGNNSSLDNKRFKLYKINGTAQFVAGNQILKFGYYYRDKESMSYTDFKKDLAKLYADVTQNELTKSSLSFAWETEKFDQSFQEIIKDTDVLIVIGYSFPYFNRKIDNHLLVNMDKLEKIYIQDTYYDIIKAKVADIRMDMTGKIFGTPSLSEFYIPHDWFNPLILDDKIVESR